MDWTPGKAQTHRIPTRSPRKQHVQHFGLQSIPSGLLGSSKWLPKSTEIHGGRSVWGRGKVASQFVSQDDRRSDLIPVFSTRLEAGDPTGVYRRSPWRQAASGHGKLPRRFAFSPALHWAKWGTRRMPTRIGRHVRRSRPPALQ